MDVGPVLAKAAKGGGNRRACWALVDTFFVAINMLVRPYWPLVRPILCVRTASRRLFRGAVQVKPVTLKLRVPNWNW
jgi:hypothetical protein